MVMGYFRGSPPEAKQDKVDAKDNKGNECEY
jgi:hypothetical protein